MESILFRSKILNASKELTQENVEEIKYLLKGDVGTGVLEKIESSLDLFNSLEVLGWISPTSLDVLYELLKGINRGDIVNTLQGLSPGNNAPKNLNGKKEVKADELIDRKILDVVANHIGSDWKRLGRMLDIQEAKIEQIDIDSRKSYEKAMQTLLMWTKCVAGSWELLKNALGEVPRYDIVRTVENNFPDLKEPQHAAPGALVQATSISDDVTHYATTNLANTFGSMTMEEDEHGVRPKNGLSTSSSVDSEIEVVSRQHLQHDNPGALQPPASTVTTESNSEPLRTETVLANELKPL